MINEQMILQSLTKIIDPDFQKDIVSLGFVKNIKIQGNNISLDIELTTPACPVKSEFQRQAQEAIQSLAGVGQVTVNMTSQVPRQQTATPQPSVVLNQVKSIIAVSSGKGGVGKSTVAACLALELAGRGFKVGLLDADIHGPSIPALLNLQNTPVYTNEKQQLIPVEKAGLKVMSFGFLLGDAPAVMRGPIVSRYIQQLLQQTAWEELDYLFIDMPPGTGDVQLTITQSIRLSGAVIVTTPQTLSLVDVSRGILMFEKVNVPMLGLIENMSYFICDNCHKKHFIFGENKTSRLEDRFGLPLLAELPIMGELITRLEKPVDSPAIREAVDRVVRAIGKSNMENREVPKIAFDEKTVRLEWKNGEIWVVNNRDLRLSCRCALCVNELTGEQIFTEKNLQPDIQAKEILPLGNYAIGVNWNDGHSSGIYPYKSIRDIAKKEGSGVPRDVRRET